MVWANFRPLFLWVYSTNSAAFVCVTSGFNRRETTVNGEYRDGEVR